MTQLDYIDNTFIHKIIVKHPHCEASIFGQIRGVSVHVQSF